MVYKFNGQDIDDIMKAREEAAAMQTLAGISNTIPVWMIKCRNSKCGYIKYDEYGTTDGSAVCPDCGGELNRYVLTNKYSNPTVVES